MNRSLNADPIDRRRRRRPGFTLPEMLIVIVIVVLVAGMAFPATAKAIRRGRINQAANVVAADLESAVSYAARQRKRVRIVHAPGAKSFTITDKAGNVIRSRELGQQSEWKVAALTFSVAATEVFPAGVTSGALTVQVGDGSYTRRVRLSRAGLVQVVQ